MANGFGESFGSAYARSLQMTREEQEKQREKDRRQALLLQLVGAPVAQGIVTGVSTIIQEPFNESAVNFFNTEQGVNLRLRQQKVANERSVNDINYKKLMNSADGGWTEFAKPKYDAWLEDYNNTLLRNRAYKKPEDMPGYGEAVLEQRRKFRDEWLPQHRQSIVSIRDIQKNQRISSKDVWSKRPGTGIPSRYMSKIIGKKAKKFIKKNTLIKKSQLNYKI